MARESIIKSIPLRQSILLFGIPGLFLYIGLYYGIPIFHKMGHSEILLFNLFYWPPLISLLPLSIILFNREKRKNPDLIFKKRFRLNKLTKKDWLWVTAGIFLTFIFENVILGSFPKWLASFSILSPPEHFPALLNPLKEIEFPLIQFFGVSLKGNWLFIWVIIILYPISQVGEEFLWRGYILPRQEKTYGKWAWLINGLLWGFLLHFFFIKWNFISFMPTMLITPFLAQKTKNTFVALLVHSVPNAIMLVLFFFLGVLGVG